MYKYFNKCIIRTPRLPFSDIGKCFDVSILNSDPIIQEAVYLASNSLFEEFNKMYSNPHTNEKKEKN